MLRKGEVVSLAIFLIFGFLVGAMLGSGGPIEYIENIREDFGEGSISANVVMGVYNPDGEPVEVQRLGTSLLPFMWDGNGGGDGGKAITDTWKATVSSIVINGENIKPGSLNVAVAWFWESPAGTKRLKLVQLDSGDFSITGDAHSFEATSSWSGTYEKQLLALADGYNINCRVASFDWLFRVRISCSGVEAEGVTVIQSRPKELEMGFTTSYSEDPVYGDPFLSVNANIGMYSVVPGDPKGLSITFIVMTLFAGLWYWKGRNLLQWG